MTDAQAGRSSIAGDGRDGRRIVRVCQLVKRFGNLIAVDGVSFDVFQGETFGLLGPNGAGKTSIMRILTCVSPATGGVVAVDGRDVRTESRAVRDILGVVGQQDGLDPDLSVRDNLLAHARYYGLRGAPARGRADELLGFFGLRARAGAGVDTLSGGLRRRLAIARAFMTRPRVVVLDEPTTGLDPHARNRVWERLAALKALGVTIIMSTHYMDEAAMLCDRLVIMDRGKILAAGAPDELTRAYAGSETALVRVPAIGRAAAAAELRARGCTVRDSGAALTVTGANGKRPDVSGIGAASVTFRPANLEDVFLGLTGRGLRDE